MARQVHVDAPTLRQADRQCVKALDETHRIGIGVIRRQCRQALFLAGHEYAGVLAAKIRGERVEPGRGTVGGHEHQRRIGGLDQRDRTVQKLGTAEGFGMQIRGLLQLQGGLSCDRQRGPASQAHQARRLAERLQGRAPIEPHGRSEPIRQSLDGCSQLIELGPSGSKMKPGGEAGHEGLGRCHAELRPCRHRKHDVGRPRQRALGIVHDACGECAGGLGHLNRLDEVVASSGLGHRDEKLARKLQPLLVDGGDVGRKRAHREAEMAFEQMLSERRRMGRASARACQNEVRRGAPDVTQELRQRSLQRLRLPPHCVGARLPVRLHVDAGLSHRKCLGPATSWHNDSAASRANCSAPASASPRGATR
jgi:hypothetical protein